MFESKSRLYAAFALVVFATAFGSLSQTAVNAMLVSIDADFGIDAGTGQWATTAYMLVLGITVPVVTYLTKRFTLRALMVAALALFLAGSVAGFAAPTFWVLLVGRILQAISAGITMPLVQTMAMVRFPAGQNATAMGIAGIALGFAPNIGPVMGGFMVDAWGWRSFFVLLAVASVALVVGIVLVMRGEDKKAVPATLDMLSLVLSTVGFGGLLLSFSNASNDALASPAVWLPFVVGALCVVLFLRRQLKMEDPLINLAIFKSKRYVGCFLVQNTMMTSYLGITLLASLYVQGLCGGTAVDAGLVFVPATIFALFLNPLAGYATDKLGVRPVVLFGGACMTIGAAAMCFMDALTPLWLVMVLQTVRGMGMSVLMGPTMSFGLSELPREITMDGSSFLVTVRQACASLGTACMVFIVQYGLSVCGAVALPYQLAFGFSAVFAVAMTFFIVTRIK